MKILAFLSFIAMAAFLFAFSNGSENTKHDKGVLVTLEFTDGSVSEEVYNFEDLDDVTQRLGTNEVFSCTYKFSDGTCSFTKPTCEEAKALFYECACAAGHTYFCIEQD